MYQFFPNIFKIYVKWEDLVVLYVFVYIIKINKYKILFRTTIKMLNANNKIKY